jgi:hypothetical protein
MPALFSAGRESCSTRNPPPWLFPSSTDVKQLMCLCGKENTFFLQEVPLDFFLSVRIELVPSYYALS